MGEFNVKNFIDTLDQRIDTQVARTLLPLMQNRTSRDDFECILAPANVGSNATIVKHSVDRLMHRLVLDHFASVVVDRENKVAITIAAKELAASAVQTTIATELAKAHQQAEQLSL
jgi:hypothetical protein